MTALASAVHELDELIRREGSLIESEYRDAIARDVMPSVARARSEAALQHLWGWEKYLGQRIGNALCIGLPPTTVDPEPKGRPFPRTLRVMLDNFATGESLADALGGAIADVAVCVIIGQLLGLPALDFEVRLRGVVRDEVRRLAQPLVTDSNNEDGTSSAETMVLSRCDDTPVRCALSKT